LLISEVALTVVLVTGAMLLAESTEKLVRVNLHFEPERLLSLAVSFSNATTLSPGFDERTPVLFREFRNTIEAIPGVKTVALLDCPILQLDKNPNQFKANGGAGLIAQEYQPAEFHIVTPGYFDMMGVELLQGRGLAETDSAKSLKVAVINDAMLKRYWQQTDPLGLSVAPLIKYGKDDIYTIVGIVREPKRFGTGQSSSPTVYVPYDQLPLPSVTLLVRASRDPRELSSSIHLAAMNILPGHMFVGPTQTGEELLSQANARTQFTTLLLSVLAGLALLLAIVGVYGVMSYYTEQRTREIGIRVAFGGQRGDISNLVLKQSLKLTVVGILVGLIGAFVLVRGISQFLYEVAPTDWRAFGAAVLILLALAVVATWIPARRAMRVDPMEALRHE